MLFADVTDDQEALKGALFGLLPDNWRTWLVVIGVVIFVITNPQAAWFVGSKIVAGIAFLIGKAKAITPSNPSIPPATDAGIDSPLANAQAQIAWAVRNGNAEVLQSGMTTLQALAKLKAPAVALLLFCLVGCSQATSQKAAPDDCQYSRSHSFGYQPPPPAEKEKMYHDEPTLFQQEPSLANTK